MNAHSVAFGISFAWQRWFYLFALSLIWGSSYILIKIGLAGFGYIESATIRILAAGVLFLPVVFFNLKKVPLRKIPLLALSGLLGVFIPAYLFCLSQQHIQSSVAGILIAMTPCFTFLISIVFFKKKYGITQISGLILGFACCVALSLFTASGSALSLNGYVLLILVATLCYGVNINFVKAYLSDVPSLQLSTWSGAINGLLAFFCVFLPQIGRFHFERSQTSSLMALLALGVLGTALGQTFHNRLITISSPLFASAPTYLIPVVAIFWGVMDHEPISLIHFIVITGLLISVYLIRKEKI